MKRKSYMKLDKNDTSYFEQILEAAINKTALPTHLKNYVKKKN